MRRISLLLCVLTAHAFGQADVPAWQTAAGGTMTFDVASIRLSKPDTFTPPKFPLSADDSYRPNGGVFTSGFSVQTLISFAYKLDADMSKLMQATLPKWALSDAYTVEAKTENTHATKDQMRLMVQALLADRFAFRFHFETREVPVLALTLVTPGKTGPKLRPHSEGPACDVVASPGIFPAVCDIYSMMRADRDMNRMGSRNTTLALMAPMLNNAGRFGRPLVDRTGLTGRFDFTIEWTLDDAEHNPTGDPDFMQAMQSQLGLKLDPAKAMLRVMVVDGVEKPSEN